MQAARGTSLSDAASPRPVRPTSPRPRLRLLLAAVAVAAYSLDVATKVLAVDRLTDRDIEVLGPLLTLHLTRNPGAAFSAGTEYTQILTGIAIVAVVVVLWFMRKAGSTAWAVALGLLLAGISGNLTDRLLREPGPLRGHVIDFLMVPHWPVFNFADICINVAAGLILLQAFRGVRLDGTREGSGRKDRSGEEMA